MKQNLMIFLCCIGLFFLLLPASASELSWTQATEHAAFSPRMGFSLVVFDDRMWVIGGLDPNHNELNDVWYSSDGISWQQATDPGAFTPRYGHSSVVFNDRMWVIGGYNKKQGYLNDVWYTTDGISWEQATPDAEFMPRMLHSSVVHNGKIWVIGGEIRERPYVCSNDVWYSSDGTDWEQATDSAPFAARSGLSSVVFNDKIWVAGGTGDAIGNVAFNDIWTSSDGKNWQLVNSSAGFTPRYYFPIIAGTGNLEIIGGDGGMKELNDNWISEDGSLWYEVSTGNNFPARSGYGAIQYDGRIWIIGGVNQQNRYFNDVWYRSEISAPLMSTGLEISKSISPWSIKKGTEARVSITFTNKDNSPVHDIQILDTILPGFTITSGKNQTLVSQTLMPNESRILVYTVRATESGSYVLPPATVLYAGADGNYHKIKSNSLTVDVISPIISEDGTDIQDGAGSSWDDLLENFFALFSRKNGS